MWRKIIVYKATNKQIIFFQIFVILLFSVIPLFFTYPYRINIFLSWEGAYRIYSGQVPFKDFGIPMGYAYWLIPALFFKIFGPYLFTLVKAQVFINFISNLAFLFILRAFKLSYSIILIAIIVFNLSYTILNFWPWYNHTVIVFQLIGLSFLLNYILNKNLVLKPWLYLLFASFFTFLSFFTKQDAGAMAFLICIGVLTINFYFNRNYMPAIKFFGFYIVFGLLFIFPLLPYNFTYWFNLGQEPHFSRISIYDFIEVFFSESKWIKFYALIITIFFLKEIKSLFLSRNNKEILFYTLILGMLFEAFIFQITSYVPPDNNIFFHSFFIAFIFYKFSQYVNIPNNTWSFIIITCLLTSFWWSENLWKYSNKKIKSLLPQKHNKELVSRNSWSLKTSKEVNWNTSNWETIDLKAFEKIYMPPETITGIKKILNLPVYKEKKENINLLNMTELTPLAEVMGYDLIADKNKPLWFHKGVVMFDKEIINYCNELSDNKYDIVLFEHLPGLNNFYPFEVRDCLQKNYELIFKFPAPRSDGYNEIEVYETK